MIMSEHEPLPSFKPFWRFLLFLIVLTVAIALVSAATGLALSE